MNWFEDFETRHLEVNGARIFARVSRGAQGARPALLLLHGFPQSHVMWHRVAQRLQQDFYLVLPDLRGYGDSSKAPGLPARQAGQLGLHQLGLHRGRRVGGI